MRNFIERAPFAYFSGIWVWIALQGTFESLTVSIGPLIAATMPVLALMARSKTFNILLGIFMFFWSFLILFAYLSDASKAFATDSQTWSFLFFGGLISVLNFLMAYLIVKQSLKKKSLTTDISAAAI